MRLEPSVAVKRLVDAEPGELVRTRLNDVMVLALIAEYDGRHLIVLEKYQDHVFVPLYFPLRPDRTGIGLSFGHNYVFGFDPADGRIVDPSGHNLFRANGVLILQGATAFIRVISSDINRSSAHYEIQSGNFVNLPQAADEIYLSKWNIQLRQSSLNHHVLRIPGKPFFEFEATQ